MASCMGCGRLALYESRDNEKITCCDTCIGLLPAIRWRVGSAHRHPTCIVCDCGLSASGGFMCVICQHVMNDFVNRLGCADNHPLLYYINKPFMDWCKVKGLRKTNDSYEFYPRFSEETVTLKFDRIKSILEKSS